MMILVEKIGSKILGINILNGMFWLSLILDIFFTKIILVDENYIRG